MLYAIAALLVLIADQALKYYVTLNIPLDEGVIPMIPGIMSLVNYHNTGAAFSMLSGGGARWAFVILAVGFTAWVCYALINRKVTDKFLSWTLVLVAAGAIGNAIDRAMYGYVVDMFRTDFMNFAIFNVADIFITLGGIALCIAIIRLPDPDKEQPSEAEKKPGVRLFSRKKKLPPEVEERRRSGKIFGEKKPFDAADPFAEFDGKPKQFTKPTPVPTPEEAEELARAQETAQRVSAELEKELELEAILREFADGDY